MTKRKLAQSQPAPNYNVPDIFPQNLQNKINFIPSRDKTPEIYNDINSSKSLLSQSQIDLANFIFREMGNNANFPKLNLNNKTPSRKDPQAYYNMRPENREITMYRPDNPSINPLTTLMHEGTHFLDDERMRTYQQPAINFLNKHMGKIRTDQDTGDWYTHAQNILPSRKDFTIGYPFSKVKSGADSLKNHYVQQYLDNPGSQQPTTDPTYSDLHTSLNLPNKEGRIYSQMSEFPGFIVEGLDQPWVVDWVQKGNQQVPQSQVQNYPYSNIGRKFLKKMTKATYTGFRDIYNQHPIQDQTFIQSYPSMHQSFLDRLSDIRNVNKHSDANTFKQTMDNRLYPSLNTPMTTTSTTVPTTSNINTTTTTPTVNPLLNAMTTTPTNNLTPQFQTTVTRQNDSPGKLIFQRTPGTERSVRFQPY
jgi:hypothetical protein